MSELRAGSPKREAMLRAKMMKELRTALPDALEADLAAFADAFVRSSRPPGIPDEPDLFGPGRADER